MTTLLCPEREIRLFPFPEAGEAFSDLVLSSVIHGSAWRGWDEPEAERRGDGLGVVLPLWPRFDSFHFRGDLADLVDRALALPSDGCAGRDLQAMLLRKPRGSRNYGVLLAPRVSSVDVGEHLDTLHRGFPRGQPVDAEALRVAALWPVFATLYSIYSSHYLLSPPALFDDLPASSVRVAAPPGWQDRPHGTSCATEELIFPRLQKTVLVRQVRGFALELDAASGTRLASSDATQDRVPLKRAHGGPGRSPLHAAYSFLNTLGLELGSALADHGDREAEKVRKEVVRELICMIREVVPSRFLGRGFGALAVHHHHHKEDRTHIGDADYICEGRPSSFGQRFVGEHSLHQRARPPFGVRQMLDPAGKLVHAQWRFLRARGDGEERARAAMDDLVAGRVDCSIEEDRLLCDDGGRRLYGSAEDFFAVALFHPVFNSLVAPESLIDVDYARRYLVPQLPSRPAAQPEETQGPSRERPVCPIPRRADRHLHRRAQSPPRERRWRRSPERRHSEERRRDKKRDTRPATPETSPPTFEPSGPRLEEDEMISLSPVSD